MLTLSVKGLVRRSAEPKEREIEHADEREHPVEPGRGDVPRHDVDEAPDRVNHGHTPLHPGKLLHKHIAQMSRLEAGHAYAGAGRELLLVYDRADRFVDHGDGDLVLGWCPGATLIKTASHGHTRILAAPELADLVAGSIAAGESQAQHAVQSDTAA